MLIIVGNAWARKMLENGADSHLSSARGVGWRLCKLNNLWQVYIPHFLKLKVSLECKRYHLPKNLIRGVL
jgi:hypothetical protein